MEASLVVMGVTFITLKGTKAMDLPDLLAKKPTVILASIESLVDPVTMAAIRSHKMAYILSTSAR